MHPYKSMHVMAIDAGTPEPFITMTLSTGPNVKHTCTAQKIFPMDRWDEVRDIIGWASHAFLSAADQLGEDGWTIEHHTGCDDCPEVTFDA